MTIPTEPLWLTDEELREFTGYVRATCQARWLSENRIKFYLNALHKIRVPRDAVTATRPPNSAPKRTEPDFSKIRRAN
jgi:hypothetical protein